MERSLRDFLAELAIVKSQPQRLEAALAAYQENGVETVQDLLEFTVDDIDAMYKCRVLSKQVRTALDALQPGAKRAPTAGAGGGRDEGTTTNDPTPPPAAPSSPSRAPELELQRTLKAFLADMAGTGARRVRMASCMSNVPDSKRAENMAALLGEAVQKARQGGAGMLTTLAPTLIDNLRLRAGWQELIQAAARKDNLPDHLRFFSEAELLAALLEVLSPGDVFSLLTMYRDLQLPVPVFYRLPGYDQAAVEGKDTEEQLLARCWLSDMRVFLDERPHFVLSIGTESVRGKSSLLAELHQRDATDRADSFRINARRLLPLHSHCVDLAVDPMGLGSGAEAKPITQQQPGAGRVAGLEEKLQLPSFPTPVLDVHGAVAGKEVFLAHLTQQAPVVLLHVDPNDINEAGELWRPKDSAIWEILRWGRGHLLLLVRDVTGDAAPPKLGFFAGRVAQACGQRRYVTTLFIPRPDDYLRREPAVQRAQRQYLKSLSEAVNVVRASVPKGEQPFETFDSLAASVYQALIAAFPESGFVPFTPVAFDFDKHAVDKDGKLRQDLMSAWFPLGHWHLQQAKLDEERRELQANSRGLSREERQVRLQKLTDAAVQLREPEVKKLTPPVAMFRNAIASKDPRALSDFDQLLFFWRRRHLGPLYATRKRLRELVDSKSITPAQQRELKQVDSRIDAWEVTMETFWRELAYFTTKQANAEGATFDGVVDAGFRAQFHAGLPIEFLDGDTLKIQQRFFENVLHSVKLEPKDSRLYVVSVIGPQSTAKSTLLNWLYGCQFRVSAGRCTKGMYVSHIRTAEPGFENLAILDTEGLQRTEKPDPLFDRRMTLGALSVSDVVLINVKGEMAQPMQDILEVCLYGLQRLALRHQRPRVLFILRDMSSNNADALDEARTRVHNNLQEVCRRFLRATTKQDLSLEDIIDYDPRRSFFLMPSAFNTVGRHEPKRNLPSPAFAEKCRQLRDLIFGFLRERAGPAQVRPEPGDAKLHVDESKRTAGFPDFKMWAIEASARWSLISGFGDLVGLATMVEHEQRRHLGNHVQALTKTYLEGEAGIHATMSAWASRECSLIQGDKDAKRESVDGLQERFSRQLAKTAAELAGTMERHFLEETKHFPENLRLEYKQTLQDTILRARGEIELSFARQTNRLRSECEVRQELRGVRRFIASEQAANRGSSLTDDQLKRRFEGEWKKRLEDVRQRAREQSRPSQKIEYELDGMFYNWWLQRRSADALYSMVELRRNSPAGDMVGPPTWKQKITFQIQARARAIDRHQATIQTALRDILIGVRERGIQLEQAAVWAVIDRLHDVFKDVNTDFQVNFGSSLNLHYTTYYVRYLFHGLLNIFVQREQQMEANEVAAFDAEKANYLESYLLIVKNVRNDEQSGKTIANFMVGSITKYLQAKIEPEMERLLRVEMAWRPSDVMGHCYAVAFDAKDRTFKKAFEYVTEPIEFADRICRERFEQIKSSKKLQIKALLFDRLYQNVWGDISDAVTAWSTSVPAPASEDEKSRTADCFADYMATAKGRRLKAPLAFSVVSLNRGLPIHSAPAVSAAILDRLRATLDQRAIFEMVFTHAIAVVEPRLLLESRGCDKKCPLCSQKCSEDAPGHTTHRCGFHLLNGFGGVSELETNKILYSLCTSEDAYTSTWQMRDEAGDPSEPMPYTDFLQRYYPEWRIERRPLVLADEIQKRAFKVLHDRLCAHYNLSPNPPPW